MSKKDYVLIAKEFEKFCDYSEVQALALSLAEKLSAENPRFDKGRFLTSCGVTE